MQPGGCPGSSGYSAAQQSLAAPRSQSTAGRCQKSASCSSALQASPHSAAAPESRTTSAHRVSCRQGTARAKFHPGHGFELIGAYHHPNNKTAKQAPKDPEKNTENSENQPQNRNKHQADPNHHQAKKQHR